MRKFLFSFIALATSFALAWAEDAPEISFENLVYDFGTFPEENGRVSCVFEFTNTGTADLILQKVKASCGCTTPDWTKEPVKPGEKGTINVTYNATGRPGAFTKTITVTSNAGEKRLSIKGEVIPKAQKVEDKYPYDFSGLRMMKKNVYFNTIYYPGASRMERVEFINNSKEDIKVSFADVPKNMVVKAAPEVVKAGEKGAVEVTFETKSGDTWGSFKKDFTVLVNGKKGVDQVISVYGNVAENFSKMTAEEKADAPVLKVGNTVALPEIKAGSTKTFEFSVTNDGKNPLIIRNASCDSDNFTVTCKSTPIKQGKSQSVRVKVNAEKMSAGKFSQRLTLVTNDPQKSTYVITLSGEVK